MIKHGRTGILSEARRKDIAKSIATDRSLFDDHSDERLNGKSMDDLFSDPKLCGYLGETKRTLNEEAYRWLTQQCLSSALHADGKNRPVLRWDDRHKLSTPHEAKTILGFESVLLVEERREAQHDLCRGLPAGPLPRAPGSLAACTARLAWAITVSGISQRWSSCTK